MVLKFYTCAPTTLNSVELDTGFGRLDRYVENNAHVWHQFHVHWGVHAKARPQVEDGVEEACCGSER